MNKLISFFSAYNALLVAIRRIFIVDQKSHAIVFAFGEVKSVISEPGLHFKLPPPFQNVLLLDKRILTIDSAEADRFITAEKKNILVDSYVK
jgi:membrane protease subunit HflC